MMLAEKQCGNWVAGTRAAQPISKGNDEHRRGPSPINLQFPTPNQFVGEVSCGRARSLTHKP